MRSSENYGKVKKKRMKNKVKNVSISISLLFALIIVGLIETLSKIKQDRDRINSNYSQLVDSLNDHKAYALTLEELRQLDEFKIDSLTQALQVRPKTVTKVIKETITLIDTVTQPVYVEVNPVNFSSWIIRDSILGRNNTVCMRYSGEATLIDSTLYFDRTGYSSQDNMVSVYNWERKHKFWFIRYGKKIYHSHVTSDCGKSTSTVIDIYKK